MSANKGSSITEDNFQLSNSDNNPFTALKIALETMKDRCHKLQKRLNCLEDENLQLRIERHSVPGLVKKEPKSDITTLQKQVEELNRQKSLLSHHIFMVATENTDLWERLSKVTDKSELSDTSNKNDSLVIKPTKSLKIVESCKNKGGKEESLEEIPLKLVSNLRKNKFLIDDRSEETKNPVNAQDYKFPLEDLEDEEDNVLDEIVFSEVNNILEKLKTEKMMLKQQQEGLKSALEIISKHLKDKEICKQCVVLEEELEKERNSKKQMESSLTNNNVVMAEEAQEIMDTASFHRKQPAFSLIKSPKDNTQFEDRICPLCTKFYPKSTPFDEFNEHVLSHFVEEPEQDSLMSNYEIAT